MREAPALELEWEELDDADPFDQLYRALTVAYSREPSVPPPVLPILTVEEHLAGRVAELLDTRSDGERFGVLVDAPLDPRMVVDLTARGDSVAPANDDVDAESLAELGDLMTAVFDRTDKKPCAQFSASWS